MSLPCVRLCRISFSPHNNPVRWMVPAVIPLSHLRKPRLREVKSVAQGKARTYYLFQSLTDSKAQTLTYVAIFQNLQQFQLP